MVDTDFTAGIDAVLSLPEFDQPCPALIIKIDRLTVKHHIKMYSRSVKQSAISEFPLPGVLCGGDDVLLRQIGKTEGTEQFIERTYLLTKIHTADFFDDAVFLPVTQTEKEDAENQKDSKKEVHNRVLSSVSLSYVGMW